MTKNLYLISQSSNTDWDTYDSAVVCALDTLEAQKTHPSGVQTTIGTNKLWWESKRAYSDWAPNLEHVTVKFIGTAAEDIPVGVVCASFNAG